MTKALLLAVIAFILPVAGALSLGPEVFPGAFPEAKSAASIAARNDNANETASPDDTANQNNSDSDTDHAGNDTDNSGGFATIASDRALDPLPEKSFVVSFQVKFKEFPVVGRRQKIIAKYDPVNKPHIGWAIGVRRLRTSFRPELYWQGVDGRGGWYSFDSFNVVLNHWYTFTLVAVPGNYVNIFVEPSAWDATTLAEVKAGKEDAELSDDEVLSHDISFVGGYSIAELQQPMSSYPLMLAPISTRYGPFRGEVGEIVMAHPQTMPSSRRKLEAFLRGGVTALASALQTDDISLWLDSEGRDKSKFNRKLTLGASAS